MISVTFLSLMKRPAVQSVFLAALVLFVVAPALAAAPAAVNFVDHDISLRLDVPRHFAAVTDSGMVSVQAGWNFFMLSDSARLSYFRIDGKAVARDDYPYADSVTLSDGQIADLSEFDMASIPRLYFFKMDKGGEFGFSLAYEATYFEDVANVRFSREQVGNEVSATVLDQGAYLSSSACFYPCGSEKLVSFQITANIPAAWEAIADGNLVASRAEGDRKIETFRNPYKNDGLMFMAAPYVMKSVDAEGTDVFCYFFPDDSSLLDRYLEGTANYVRMYDTLIGPYPYERFTVAENFFPTGYGMPAWTLLGQQVLRLPFILGSSLGHEVLHNWWGNSVYVDYDRGNWCEAATVYGADYRYKLLSSEAEARDYRKEILKDYKSYVNEGNDFPIADFRSRTSPGTRTIGYNKGMMVYHMVNQIIGDSLFYETWKKIYADYREKQISWSEWFDMFRAVSHQDLGYMIPEWIERAGAPVLKLQIDSKAADNGQVKVNFTVEENSGQHYTLHVPVRLKTDSTQKDTVVMLSSPSGSYTIEAAGSKGSLAIDPEYHLFRSLYDEEVEPVLSAILGNEHLRYATDEKDSLATNGFQLFCNNFAEGEPNVEPAAGITNDSDTYLVVMNPSELPEYLAEHVKVTDDSIFVAGTGYPKEGFTAVLAGQNWNGFDKYMVILTSDYAALPRLGQLVPHYGKYSYLVFQGSRNVDKGQWVVTSSPLTASI